MEDVDITVAASRLDNLIDQAVDFCTQAGIKILLAILLYLVGRFIIKKLMKLFDKVGSKGKLDETASRYIRTILRFALYTLLFISIIAELGVNMSSVAAVVASCGVAVGLAMQGSLSNLAGGIMLLIFRPFRVGDYIVTCDAEGTVKEISLFYTVLNTIDNKVVSLPNGSVMNANITNVTAEETRRIDLKFNIAGNVPIRKVQATIMGVIIDTERAMADPAPMVEPFEPIPGGLTYVARVWVRSSEYWDVYFELMREIPTALGNAGIAGPSTPVSVSSQE